MRILAFRNHQTLSPEGKEQIQRVAGIWAERLGDALAGVYVHGSIALGCFAEGVSDIDMLIVTARRMPRGERLQMAEAIMALDRKPAPLEMSAIWVDDLTPWKHPTPCQFHYSGSWTQRYRKMLSGEMESCFIVDEDFADADIACHVRLTRQSGICVAGRPIADVFPAVPEEDFWQSISADIESYDFHAGGPQYVMSNILILGRVLSYKRTGRILSKHDGGLWARDQVPEGLRYILDGALQAWYYGAGPASFDSKDLEELRTFLISQIRAERAYGKVGMF